MVDGLLARDDARCVADALRAADYTVGGVADVLGETAHSALNRGEYVPGLRATTGGSPLETLVRLFLLGSTETAAAVDAVLPTAAAPFLERAGDEVRAAVDLRPYAADDDEWWVLSDVHTGTTRTLRPDHVLGVGGASVTLATATVRPQVGAALDIGTGCGVQSLHLAEHAAAITATDQNPRALRFARTTFDLNGIDAVELVEGDLLEPVGDRRFDLIVSNPPFVIGPGSRFLYRDSGDASDGLCARLVRTAPGHLTDGGWCQLLANWLHVEGEDWRERVAGWVEGSGCDAWVVQREVQDPAQYAELWLRDSNDAGTPGYASLYDAWLAGFEAQHVEAIGFGVVTLRRAGATAPVVRIEELRQEIEGPLGLQVGPWFARQDWLRATGDAALLAHPLRAADDVRLDSVAVTGPEGWAEVAQTLRLDRGLRWSGGIDEVGAAVVAGCDGERPLRELLPVLALATGIPEPELTEGALPAVRMLVEQGFLLP